MVEASTSAVFLDLPEAVLSKQRKALDELSRVGAADSLVAVAGATSGADGIVALTATPLVPVAQAEADRGHRGGLSSRALFRRARRYPVMSPVHADTFCVVSVSHCMDALCA